MSDAEGIKSPLHDVQVAAGAEFMWEGGWPWAMHIGGDGVGEYEAVRTATGIWDLFSTAKYVVTGPDAAALIQKRFTNEVASLAVGGVRYGAFVNANGTMADEGNIYRHGEENFLVMVNRTDLTDWFTEVGPGMNVTVRHTTEEMPMIAVQGPTSRQLLQGLTDTDISDLKYFRCIPEKVKVAGTDAWIQRTGYSGEIGYEVVSNPADVVTVWNALVAAGARPFGLEAVDMLRIEMGLLVMGYDYQPDETSPFDVSLDKFIKPGVGTVADATLAAVAANPPKRLKTLQIEGDAPEIGAEVTKDGAVVGTVTSPTNTPRCGTIALAILDSAVAEEGTKVEVAGASATVAPLSIVDPGKARARG